LAKRLSEKQKDEIIKLFTSGKTPEELSTEFECTKLTISRNLKKKLGEKKFQELINKGKSKKKYFENETKKRSFESDNNLDKNFSNENFDQEKNFMENNEEDFSSATPFVEITPLNYDIENVPQKDLSSIPISEIKFPNIVYMIVDIKIELEIKYLKNYPTWHFLSEEELNRKTIEIYDDLKIAKRFCSKEQKVIKVPNTEVFKIVAPILRIRGITRIVSSGKLIAL
tara:strand:+ start:786 stop:1466 length:681 start_codon:yes stop_codon:yes gene_type:complete